MTTAEIITIGTELLLGETLDTNTHHIARVLREHGISLFRSQVIGDNEERIALLVREALSRADIVLTTGGLGPTVDDPTRQAIAQAIDAPLEFHPELWEQVKSRIARYGRTPSENQSRQAYLPKDAIPIENPVGTAPSFIVELGNKCIISMPGVPNEMETILSTVVIPYLARRYRLSDIIRIRTLHVSGVGEGNIDERIGDLEYLANPTVGLSAHPGIVSIRITAKADNERIADEKILAVETALRDRLGNDIFGADDETLEGAALRAINAHNWILATLEYQTEGVLSSRLMSKASSSFRNGRIASVPITDLESEARELAQQGQATIALIVQCSIADNTIDLGLFTPAGFTKRALSYGGHPRNLQTWAVNMALDWLRRTALAGS
jgi:nicotinamide-nucleotide amidase